jgi:Putative adhesin
MAQQWQIDEPKVLDIGNENETVGKLRLSLVGGRVDIVTHDDSPTARLEVHEVSGLPLVVSWDGWTLNISHVKDKSGSLWESVKSLGLDKGRRSARISISVPATTDISSNTVSAEALINGARASVKANTVSGSLTLDDIIGDVDAKTVSGDIEGHALEGDFSGGSVSGALTVQASRLRQIKLNTVSGDITLDLTDGAAQIQSNTVSGDVTVRVPSGGGYDVAAHTASGHIVIDGQSMNGDTPQQRGGRLSEGDKALVIKANSVSGNVVVLRTGDLQNTSDIQDPKILGSTDVQDSADVQDLPPRDLPGKNGSVG